MVIAMGVFIGSDSVMKIAMADAPLFQLVAMRGLAAVGFCLALIVTMVSMSMPEKVNRQARGKGGIGQQADAHP